MYQSFDPFEYLDCLRRRWRVVAVACLAAVAISLPLSLLLPKRYTATATMVIDPPAGVDARNSIVVSPVYLESLKTYERYAESDTLFARAAERFHLVSPESKQAIEPLKRSVLKVSKLRDTKIMEIGVTLRDPNQAQQVAQYIAEQTALVSRGENADVDNELVNRAQKQAATAQEAVDRAQKSMATLTNAAPLDALQSELDGDIQLLEKLREQLIGAETDVAEYQQQQSQADGQFIREQLQAARARVTLLEKRTHDQERTIEDRQKALAARSARKEQAEADLKAAQFTYQSAARALNDAQAATGMRGERLRVIDPGIVPQRPSSPNIPLNVTAALFLALIGSLAYVSFAFVFRRRTVGFEPAVPRSMRA